MLAPLTQPMQTDFAKVTEICGMHIYIICGMHIYIHNT